MQPEDVTPEPSGTTGSELVVSGGRLPVGRRPRLSNSVDLRGLIAIAQLDDAGANTADLYDWQAAMAAADGLALYLDALGDTEVLGPECGDFIVCEWHEDWVVVGADATELVSCKHRSPDVGAFTTVNALADQGGLAHLFNRWAALEQKPMCRLVTTGGVTGPARELKLLANRLRDLRRGNGDLILLPGEESTVKQLREKIKVHDTAMTVEDQDDEVVRFLSTLSIATVDVNKGVVRDAAPTKYVKPILERMGVDTQYCEPVWQAVLSLVRERMQSHGQTFDGDLPAVLQRHRTGGADQDMPRQVASRLVRLEDIQIAIDTALAIPAAYRTVPSIPAISRVELKMTDGGCPPNAVGRATPLRVDYEDHWREQESSDPGARIARRKLEGVLRRLSDHTMGDLEVSGTEFWRALEVEVTELEGSGGLPPGVDSEIALGGICYLSNQCQVWFGPRFDIEAAIAARRTEGAIQQ